MARLLASAYWLWSAFIAVVAGFLGSGLRCEDGDCRPGSPPRFQPWTWNHYYVVPEAFYLGLGGLVAASAFVYFVVAGRLRHAVVAFLLSLALLIYPFFAGLTEEGREIFVLGPLLAVIALVARRREIANPS
jgi:hypothetical protein